MANASVRRLEAVAGVVEKLKSAYPDAKKLNIDIRFEWKEPADMYINAELCPVVKIDVER